jgi:hypothetical protein
LAVELKDAYDIKAATKLQREIDQLRFFKLYLETNPKPETVLKMRDDIVKKIEVIERRFGQWSAGKSDDVNKLKAQYNSLMGIGDLKHKLKALNYLCD